MSLLEEALELHKKWKGKIEVVSTVPVKNQYEIGRASCRERV